VKSLEGYIEQLEQTMRHTNDMNKEYSADLLHLVDSKVARET
jgi:hypothetical protein